MKPVPAPLERAYRAALADGLSEKSARREAFVRTYRITTRSGTFLSREAVIATVAAGIRRIPAKDAGPIARLYVDNHEWLKRYAGETAGSVAREVRSDRFGWWAR